MFIVRMLVQVVGDSMRHQMCGKCRSLVRGRELGRRRRSGGALAAPQCSAEAYLSAHQRMTRQNRTGATILAAAESSDPQGKDRVCQETCSNLRRQRSREGAGKNRYGEVRARCRADDVQDTTLGSVKKGDRSTHVRGMQNCDSLVDCISLRAAAHFDRQRIDSARNQKSGQWLPGAAFIYEFSSGCGRSWARS